MEGEKNKLTTELKNYFDLEGPQRPSGLNSLPWAGIPFTRPNILILSRRENLRKKKKIWETMTFRLFFQLWDQTAFARWDMQIFSKSDPKIPGLRTVLIKR